MRLIVGRISKPHGIRGEVIVEVRTDDPRARFAAGSVLHVDPAGVVPSDATLPATVTVEVARAHQGRYILQLTGVADRTAADTLRGVLLCVDSDGLPANPDPDEFNDYELVGLVAVDVRGQRLGEVVRIEHAPAADLLVLRRPDGGSALVPFVRAIVPEVDVAAGRVVLTPPEGLLEL